MATGLGKTTTIAFDVKSWLKGNPKCHVLYLCHQNDILEQSKDEFEEIIGRSRDTFGLYHGKRKEIEAQILFASFQTMRRHLAQFRKNRFGYIIIDESHHSEAVTYKPIIEYFEPKFLLGITATPDRGDLKDIRKIFGKEVFSLNLPEALANNLLTDVKYRLVTDELVNLSKIKKAYRLTLKELNKRLFIPKRDDEIVRIIRRKISGIKNPRIMVFCSSIKHANRFCSHIPSAIAIHSKLPKNEQKKRLEAFREGHQSIAVTVDKFNEGINIPEINVVVFLRSTQSNIIFLQQLGRGLRKVAKKDNVLVLDFIANCDRVKMIYDLAEKVQRIQRKKRKRKLPSQKPVLITGLRFEFTDKVKEIIEILKRIQTPYTRESLIDYLRDIAKKLGRSPSIEDVNRLSRKKRGWSAGPIVDIFGSFNNALREAGLPIRKKHKNSSKEEAIKKLKDLYIKLGRTPSNKDMGKASKLGECPSEVTYMRWFGSFNNALELAGIKPRPKRHSKEDIINYLKILRKELGKIPSGAEIQLLKEENPLTVPSLATLKAHFGGSLRSALKAADLNS